MLSLTVSSSCFPSLSTLIPRLSWVCDFRPLPPGSGPHLGFLISTTNILDEGNPQTILSPPSNTFCSFINSQNTYKCKMSFLKNMNMVISANILSHLLCVTDIKELPMKTPVLGWVVTPPPFISTQNLRICRCSQLRWGHTGLGGPKPKDRCPNKKAMGRHRQRLQCWGDRPQSTKHCQEPREAWERQARELRKEPSEAARPGDTLILDF